MQPLQHDCNTTNCRVHVCLWDLQGLPLSLLHCLHCQVPLHLHRVRGWIRAVAGFALSGEAGHQEQLKATQWTISSCTVSCAIPTLAADTYCLYFMLYMHVFAVWWPTWSCWPPVQLLKGASSFHNSTCSCDNTQPSTALSLCTQEKILPALSIA